MPESQVELAGRTEGWQGRVWPGGPCDPGRRSLALPAVGEPAHLHY